MDEEESDYLRHAKWLESIILKLVQAQYMADPNSNAVPLNKQTYLTVLLELGREAQRHHGLEESRKLYNSGEVFSKMLDLLRDLHHQIEENSSDLGPNRIGVTLTQNMVDRIITLSQTGTI